MPVEFIYEPWRAPSAVQREAGCVIGRDYPLPIVNHGEVEHISFITVNCNKTRMY